MNTYRDRSRNNAGSKATKRRTRGNKDSRPFGRLSCGWGVMKIGMVRRALTSSSSSPSSSPSSERATADETGHADRVGGDGEYDIVDEVCTCVMGQLKRLIQSRWGGRFVIGLLLFSIAEGLLLWNTWSTTGVAYEQLGIRSSTNSNNNGWPEKCSAECYMSNNEDLQVKFAGKSEQHALKHYLKLGRSKGRSCICSYLWPEGCSWKCYREKNKDLSKFNEKQAFAHWNKRGKVNGRDCSCSDAGWPENCSARCYTVNNPDLKNLPTDGTVLNHWKKHGKNENRDCVCHS